MTLSIHAVRLDLTAEIRQLVEAKVADALRPLGRTDLDPIMVDVELDYHSGRYGAAGEDHAYRAEVTVTGYGALFRAEAFAPELNQAVTGMKHELTRQVRDWRLRLRDAQRRGARKASRRD